MKPLKSVKSIFLLCLFFISMLVTVTSCTDLESEDEIDTIENPQSTGDGDGGETEDPE